MMKNTHYEHKILKKNQKYKKNSKQVNVNPLTLPKNIIYVALDTCILIDMEKYTRKSAPIRKSPAYFSAIRNLLSNSYFTKDGARNPAGRIVFCILPTVLEELSDKKHLIYKPLKEFVENRAIILTPRDSLKSSFNRKLEKITTRYKEKGYFLDKRNQTTFVKRDGYAVAEAAIFNLIFVSRDKHITINYNDKNPQKKLEEITTINRKALGDSNNTSILMKVDYLLKKLNNGTIYSQIENTDFLDDEKQGLIYEINHNKKSVHNLKNNIKFATK